MILTIFILTCASGILWIPDLIDSGPDWVQLAGSMVAVVCGVTAILLFVKYAANEVIRIRRAHYQATQGVQLGYAIEFVQVLRHLTTSQTKELFDLAVITAKGLPGMPIVWMLEFPGGKVGLSVLVDFLNACIENYDEVARELWPVRDHEKRYFGKDAERELGIITDWLVMEGLANPARGSKAATWALNAHPVDVKRGMGL